MALPKFNIQSPTMLSLLLFGGELEVSDVEIVLDELKQPVYIKTGLKKGELKLRKVLKKVRIKGLSLNPQPNWKTKKVGIYQTNTKILQIISGADDERN